MTGTLIETKYLDVACKKWLERAEDSAPQADVEYIKQLQKLSSLNLLTATKLQVPIPTAVFIDAKAASLLYDDLVVQYN